MSFARRFCLLFVIIASKKIFFFARGIDRSVVYQLANLYVSSLKSRKVFFLLHLRSFLITILFKFVGFFNQQQNFILLDSRFLLEIPQFIINIAFNSSLLKGKF
jgi:hypothetical protein